jgi:ParB-like chromosome segregation protein Spo0J
VKKFERLELKQVAQLLENTARKDLYPLEVAEQLLLLQHAGYSQVRLQELIGKDRKTIGRFQKMANWPKEAKDIIKSNSDALKAGFLLQLASRDLSTEDLLNALKVKAGLMRKGATSKPGGAHLMRTRFEEAMDRKALTDQQKILFLELLEEVGILPSDKKISKKRGAVLTL